MLHLIPAPLHRVLYRIGHGLRRVFLRHLVGEVHGCCIIGRDERGRILLVRHSYGPPVWALPGGGIRKGEDPQAAALRELQEELGCTLAGPVHLGMQSNEFLGSTNHVQVFTGLLAGQPTPDMREVVECRFFALDDLPERRSRTVAYRIAMLTRDGG